MKKYKAQTAQKNLAEAKTVETIELDELLVYTMRYYSDANQTYRNLQYSGKHFYFRDKSHTFTVESINSDIRKYIEAL